MMRKIFVFLFISIRAITITHAQNDWINYKIDNKLSVKFPRQPLSKNGAVVAQTKDSLICFAMIMDRSTAASLDSAGLASLAPTNDFANGLKTGILRKMPGSTLGDVETGKWNGYFCYHVDGANGTKKLNIYFYFVLIGSKAYCLGAIFPEKMNPKGKNDFFNPLILN